MRFIAIKRHPYDTWRMRLSLTLIMLGAAVLLPLRADAFDLEENLKAQHVQHQGEPLLQVSQSDGMSLSEAIESVRSRTGGRVVSAETKVSNGREVHYIKVLTEDGKVKTHKVNGRRR
jgi:uncharacterized membrane protein YkoI